MMSTVRCILDDYDDDHVHKDDRDHKDDQDYDSYLDHDHYNDHDNDQEDDDDDDDHNHDYDYNHGYDHDNDPVHDYCHEDEHANLRINFEDSFIFVLLTLIEYVDVTMFSSHFPMKFHHTFLVKECMPPIFQL